MLSTASALILRVGKRLGLVGEGRALRRGNSHTLDPESRPFAARRLIRSTFGLERVGVTVVFAVAVIDRAFFGDFGPQRQKQASAFAEFIPAGADIEVASASYAKSLREKVPSIRPDLSNAFTSMSIRIMPRSW